MSERGLVVNAPQVIHETINGEVVIINLATGNYYSVKGAGADVWAAIEASPGAPRPELIAALEARYDGGNVEAEVGRFLEELCAEGLVAETDAVSRPAGREPGGTRREPFETPVLEKYTDMQDLVLLDPVHEVDAAGWPQTRPDVATA